MFTPAPGFPEGLVFSGLGLLIGIVSAAFGVGGGFAYYPFLSLVVGLPESSAVATSTAQIPFNSLGGFLGHIAKHNVVWRSAWLLMLGAVPAAFFSAQIISDYRSNADLNYFIKAMYIAVIGLSGIYTLTKTRRAHKSGEQVPDEAADLHPVEQTMFGALTGFLSGFIGIGGGTFMVPYLMFRLNVAPRKAIGTSVAVMLAFTSMAFIRFVWDEATGGESVVDFIIVFYIIIGALAGGQIGARIVTAANPTLVRVLFGSFQILLIIVFFFLKF